MPYLDQFSDDQRELIISLPFRTGLWVSESDDSGDEESEEAEAQALESLITGYAEDFLKSEFVEEVMRATLASKGKWGNWAERLDRVPEECQLVSGIIESQMEMADALSYRQSLMEIAKTVAMAYRELDVEENSIEKYKAYARYYWLCFKANMQKKAPPMLDEILNISREEHESLIMLSEALMLDMQANPVSEYE